MQALKKNLGAMGGATSVDVLKLYENGIALIRIPNSNAENVWAALTLYGITPSQKRIAFTVLEVSPYLLGLAFNSREGN